MQQFTTCPHCGANIKPRQKFCTSCGSPVNNPIYNTMPIPVQESKSNNSGFYFMIGAIILLVCVTIAVIFIPRLSDNNTAHNNNDIPYDMPQNQDTPSAPKNTVSSYTVYQTDATWEDAQQYCQSHGGKLVCINSAEEFEKICAWAVNDGLSVFWAGAKRHPSDNWGNVCWVDGSQMTLARWLSGEPTYFSEEGEDETYLMVFKVGDSWYFNDSINDVSEYYTGRMGFIMEVEEEE